jgi:hypothetical protein
MNEDGKKSASPLSPRLAEADLATATLPFETEALRKQLTDYLDQLVQDPVTGKSRKLGSYKWGFTRSLTTMENPFTLAKPMSSCAPEFVVT